MPQNHHLIATKSSLSEVTIFDTSKHTVTTEPPGKVKPQIRLGGHTKEGYGLAWNPIRSGMLISGSEDCLICMWDINARSATQPVSPSNIFKGHSSAVEDVAWHVKQEHVFGSVGDDKQLLMWDIREPSRFVQSVVAHKMDVHSIAFNPFCEHLLATSSADKTVALWDLRNLKSRLYELVGHSDEVLPIAWSPHCESVIGSAGRDRRLHVWDLSRIGDKQTAEEAADGPPELLFIHGGHTGSVVDFAFDTRDPWLMSSVAEGNILQTWKMAETIFSECAFTTLSPAPTSTASTTSTSTTTSTSAAAKKGT
ncbi:retinoblastoma-associated proteins 46/48 [Pelomyxa schiedti]|nr:retinoblastoma-associated proteins 46/48 [Pelomyxa schiedti]